MPQTYEDTLPRLGVYVRYRYRHRCSAHLRALCMVLAYTVHVLFIIYNELYIYN